MAAALAGTDLAGAGGADSEDDGVLVDRVDVLLLPQRLRADGQGARCSGIDQSVQLHLVCNQQDVGGLAADHAGASVKGDAGT